MMMMMMVTMMFLGGRATMRNMQHLISLSSWRQESPQGYSLSELASIALLLQRSAPKSGGMRPKISQQVIL